MQWFFFLWGYVAQTVGKILPCLDWMPAGMQLLVYSRLRKKFLHIICICIFAKTLKLFTRLLEKFVSHRKLQLPLLKDLWPNRVLILFTVRKQSVLVGKSNCIRIKLNKVKVKEEERLFITKKPHCVQIYWVNWNKNRCYFQNMEGNHTPELTKWNWGKIKK